MTSFASRVARLAGVEEDRLSRLAGGDLSEVLLVRRPDGRRSVAKGGATVAAEAAMLRGLLGRSVPAPMVEGEHDGLLFLEFVENDRIFSPAAWTDIGNVLRRLHEPVEEPYGWPVDYRIGTVELINRQRVDWPGFWAEQRLVSTARVLDRPWRDRVEQVAMRIADLLPSSPPSSHLHGDLWSGNILVAEGRLAALIDPASYHGDCEVDLAMLALFDSPPKEFEAAYGPLEPGWETRRLVYQLFPILVHLRLFGATYEAMADRLLRKLDV